MTAWNVETFFSRFENGTLGRKTQYSTYWVNDFAGCRILCNKISGRRSKTEAVYGIYMGPELCVFNSDYMGSVSHTPRFQFPFKEDDDVTESGIVDSQVTAGNRDARSVLFQIGHAQYLLEPHWAHSAVVSYTEVMNAPTSMSVNIMDGAPVNALFGCSSSRLYIRGVFKKLNGKFNSVKDARMSLIPEDVIAHPNEAFQFKNWWFAPASYYEPKTLSKDEMEILEHPPMPWHYGLTTQVVAPILSGTTTIETAITKANLHRFFDANVLSNMSRYAAAKKQYEGIVSKLNTLYFDQDEGPDFKEFILIPGQASMFVQKHSNGRYYIKGDLRSKNSEHFSIRYHGIEKAYNFPMIKILNDWHVMVKEF